jgi:hypothetical protein
MDATSGVAGSAGTEPWELECLLYHKDSFPMDCVGPVTLTVVPSSPQYANKHDTVSQ